MIIDRILDRKDGFGYNAREFYCYCNGLHEHGNNIARAMDAGTNEDIQIAICAYIIDHYGCEYFADIREYINGCNWLEDEAPRNGATITPEQIAAFLAMQNACIHSSTLKKHHHAD